MRIFPFVPCVEPVEGAGERFLTENPRSLLEKGQIAPVPIIFGYNDKEGMMMFIGTYSDIHRFGSNPWWLQITKGRPSNGEHYLLEGPRVPGRNMPFMLHFYLTFCALNTNTYIAHRVICLLSRLLIADYNRKVNINNNSCKIFCFTTFTLI